MHTLRLRTVRFYTVDDQGAMHCVEIADDKRSSMICFDRTTVVVERSYYPRDEFGLGESSARRFERRRRGTVEARPRTWRTSPNRTYRRQCTITGPELTSRVFMSFSLLAFYVQPLCRNCTVSALAAQRKLFSQNDVAVESNVNRRIQTKL